MSEKYFNLTGAFVPVFVVCIALEAFVDYKQKRGLYRFNDAISSLCHGLLQELFMILGIRAWTMLAFSTLFDLFGHVDTDATLAKNVLAFMAIEFGYYWFHRLGHEIGFMWAAHRQHHRPESYNLSTALSQGALQYSTAFFFYAPLALFGIPRHVMSLHLHINRIYQFFIHTQLVDKLPFGLEWILNSPSHHRVHHGCNRFCIDKNYGGTLIVWDRLFGTFEAERDDETIVYGLTSKATTFDPIYHNIVFFREMWQRACENFDGNWFRFAYNAVWAGPSWNGKEHLEAPADAHKRGTFDPPPPPFRRVNLYTAAAFGCAVVHMRLLERNFDLMSSWRIALCVAVIVTGVHVICAALSRSMDLAFLPIEKLRVLFALVTVEYLAWPRLHTNILLSCYFVLFCFLHFGVLPITQLRKQVDVE